MAKKTIRLCLLLLLVGGMASNACAGSSGDRRLRALSAAIVASPDDPQLYLRRALVLSDNGRHEEAFADVDFASILESPVEVSMARGILLYRLGRFADAIKQLDVFIGEFPRHAEAMHYRVRVHRDAGNTIAAIADYKTLFTLANDIDPGHYVAAAKLMIADNPARLDEALALIDQRITQVGAIPQLQQYAIQLDRQRCHSSAVIERLLTLDERTKLSAAWHVDMAEQWYFSGLPTKAQAHRTMAMELLAKSRPTPAAKKLHDRLSQLALTGEDAVQCRATFNQG